MVSKTVKNLTADAAEEASKKMRELEEQVSKLTMQGRVWAKQRGILVHNMSSLLQTAKVEIGRKDAEIGRWCFNV